MKTYCVAVMLFAAGAILANIPGGGAGTGQTSAWWTTAMAR